MSLDPIAFANLLHFLGGKNQHPTFGRLHRSRSIVCCVWNGTGRNEEKKRYAKSNCLDNENARKK